MSLRARMALILAVATVTGVVWAADGPAVHDGFPDEPAVFPEARSIDEDVAVCFDVDETVEVVGVDLLIGGPTHVVEVEVSLHDGGDPGDAPIAGRTVAVFDVEPDPNALTELRWPDGELVLSGRYCLSIGVDSTDAMVAHDGALDGPDGSSWLLSEAGDWIPNDALGFGDWIVRPITQPADNEGAESPADPRSDVAMGMDATPDGDGGDADATDSGDTTDGDTDPDGTTDGGVDGDAGGDADDASDTELDGDALEPDGSGDGPDADTDADADSDADVGPPLPDITIREIDPVFVSSLSDTAVSIAGSGFVEEMEVSIGGVALSGQAVSGPEMASGTISGGSLSPGVYDVVASIDGVEVDRLPFAVQVIPPVPAEMRIDRFTPDFLLVNEGTDLVITGAGFRLGASVLLDGTEIGPTFVLDGGLLVTFVPGGAVTRGGFYEVEVRNTNGTSVVRSNGLFARFAGTTTTQDDGTGCGGCDMGAAGCPGAGAGQTTIPIPGVLFAGVLLFRRRRD